LLFIYFQCGGLDQQANPFKQRAGFAGGASFWVARLEQVGYRFSLDFLPFVSWLMMRSRVPMNNRFERLICLALMVDVCRTAFFLWTGINRRQRDSSSYEALIERRVDDWA
jgi:hypothetical protein